MTSAALGPKQVVLAAAGAVLLAGALVYGPALLGGSPSRGACSGDPRVLAATSEEVLGVQVWGDRVVWYTNFPAANSAEFDADVYVADLRTGSVERVAGGPALQGVPTIHGSRVYWREEAFDGTLPKVRWLDMDTKASGTLASPIAGDVAPRGAYGARVLVSASNDTDRGLYVVDAETGAARRLTDYPAGVAEIWEDRIVWKRAGNQSSTGFPQIVLHELGNGTTSVVVEGPGVGSPDIHEHLVVYEARGADGDLDIRGLDLRTRVERALATNTNGPTLQQDPRVAGPWAVHLEVGLAGVPTVVATRTATLEARVVAVGVGDFDVHEQHVAYVRRAGASYEIAASCLS